MDDCRCPSKQFIKKTDKKLTFTIATNAKNISTKLQFFKPCHYLEVIFLIFCHFSSPINLELKYMCTGIIRRIDYSPVALLINAFSFGKLYMKTALGSRQFLIK